MAATYPTKKCATLVDFGSITGYVGTKNVTAVGFFSASSAGTLYGAGPTGTTIPLNSPDAISFAANTITIVIRGGTGSVIGDAEGLTFLDGRYGSGSPATIYAGLIITVVDGDDTAIVEFSGGTYARVAITNNNTNFPAASML